MINGRLSSKILIFRAAYNKRGATFKHPMPGQACSHKSFRASFTIGVSLCIPPGEKSLGKTAKGHGRLTYHLCARHRFSKAAPARKKGWYG